MDQVEEFGCERRSLISEAPVVVREKLAPELYLSHPLSFKRPATTRMARTHKHDLNIADLICSFVAFSSDPL